MSGTTHEIVTLQFGHYANFVGTHWWNTQEASFVYDPKEVAKKEINNDVLFREGQNLLGDITYTPRLVALDLKGSLNTLRQEGCLYELPEDGDDVKWSGDVTMHKSSSLPKNDFLRDLAKEEYVRTGNNLEEETNDDTELDKDVSEAPDKEEPIFGRKLYDLDDSVNVWSDFLRIHLHPRSLHILPQFTLHSETEGFDLYSQGTSLYRDDRTRREIEDRIHYFIEESDQLQGIQVLADTHDGFGGLSASVIQELSDELDNKSIMVYGTSPPIFNTTSPVQDSYRLMSTMLTLEQLSNHSSALVPLSLLPSYGRKPGPSVVLPHLHYKTDVPYHSSSVLAASLDTVTLPYRLHQYSALLPHLTQALAQGSRKMLGLYASLPYPMETCTTLVDSLMRLGDTLPWQPLTPGCPSNAPCVSQSLVVRGVPLAKLKGEMDRERSRVLDSCDTLQDIMNVYLREMADSNLNAICGVESPCKVTSPFPHIFSKDINKHGFLASTPRPDDTGVESVPVMTSLQTTPALHHTLRPLLADVGKIDIRRHHRILDEGLEMDDYAESLNNLTAIMESYADTDSGL